MRAEVKNIAVEVANQPDDFRQAGGLAGERRRKTWKSLPKYAPITPLVSATSARKTGVDDNRRSMSRQIPNRPRANVVTHRDRPNVISPLDTDDVQVSRGGL